MALRWVLPAGFLPLFLAAVDISVQSWSAVFSGTMRNGIETAIRKVIEKDLGLTEKNPLCG